MTQAQAEAALHHTSLIILCELKRMWPVQTVKVVEAQEQNVKLQGLSKLLHS